jgi:twitching motility protein PilT
VNAVLDVRDESATATLLDRIPDFFVWETGNARADADSAFCFSGSPARILVKSTGLGSWLEGLIRHIERAHPSAIDFAVRYESAGGEYLFRGHRDVTVAGTLLALRRIPREAPRLQDLALPMYWRELFLLPELCQGGLLVLAAQTGQGKSTTLAAIVRSRLEQFGGYCRAIEDPPELPIHGPHGDGICIQTPVDPAAPETGFADALRSALRSYPTTGGATICLIGEIRDSDTAVQALRASVNGHLVLTTVHAADCPTALTRVLAMAERGLGDKSARDLLSSGLRIVVHQRLVLQQNGDGWSRGQVTGQVLYSRGNDSPVANAIRRAEVASALAEPIRAQQTHLAKKGYRIRDLVQQLSA